MLAYINKWVEGETVRWEKVFRKCGEKFLTIN